MEHTAERLPLNPSHGYQGPAPHRYLGACSLISTGDRLLNTSNDLGLIPSCAIPRITGTAPSVTVLDTAPTLTPLGYTDSVFAVQGVAKRCLFPKQTSKRCN